MLESQIVSFTVAMFYKSHILFKTESFDESGVFFYSLFIRVNKMKGHRFSGYLLFF